MSLLKSPAFFALIATCVVFATSYYYFNYIVPSQDKSNKKSRNKNKKNKPIKYGGVNETIVVSSAIAGLTVWFIASYYFSKESTKVDSDKQKVNVDSSPDTPNGVKQSTESPEPQKGGNKLRSIPKLEDDDVTRSYNLLGTGISVPKSLTIPKVLVDYN